MTNITLYRKYRPSAFDDVVGQDHVVTALRHAVDNNSFSHAYLFSGSRGIGKTSVARIFAHAIGTHDRDIHEIDAASKRRIDDVRVLREEVTSLPFESAYKVYIIDEVHMLTTPAFNALLKTLEEPPAHALFILATTEVDKLPDTVTSRCQSFTFRRPSHATVRSVIIKTAEAEKCTLDDEAVSLIATLAEGSFRDAQGVLQKVISAFPDTKKRISRALVEEITGAPRAENVNAFVKAYIYKDVKAGLEAVSSIEEANSDIRTFLSLVIQRIRFILLLRFLPARREHIEEELSSDEVELLDSYARDTKAHVDAHALDVLLGALENTKWAYLPQSVVEIAILTYCDEKS